MKVFSNKILFLRIIKNIPQIMDIQRHSSVLGDTVEKLSDEASYKQLFHAYRDEEVTLSVLNRICVALDVNIGDVMEFVPEKEAG